MPDPFKSLFPPRKPAPDSDNDKPVSNIPSSPRSIFVKKPLYKTKTTERISDIPFVENPLFSKVENRPEKPKKIDRPFLFPKGVPKPKGEGIFSKINRIAREKIREANEAQNLRRETRKIEREKKRQNLAKKSPAPTPQKTKSDLSLQEQQFERLFEIYAEIYQETRSNLIASDSTVLKAGKPAWKMRL